MKLPPLPNVKDPCKFTGKWVNAKTELPIEGVYCIVYPTPTPYISEACTTTVKGDWMYAEYEIGYGPVYNKCDVDWWMYPPKAPV